jgi:hypothetical protein
METAPSSGVFQFDLPLRYTDGPSSTKCPVTIDSGFTKLDKDKTGVLSRFNSALLPAISASYKVM